MRRSRIAPVAATLGLAWLAISCADQVLGPPDDSRAPFAIDAARRAELVAAIRFAIPSPSGGMLADPAGAATIAEALDDLADRVAADDRDGARRAIESVRSAVARYRESAPSDAAGALALESISLTLYHVEMLAVDAPAPLYRAHGESS